MQRITPLTETMSSGKFPVDVRQEFLADFRNAYDTTYDGFVNVDLVFINATTSHKFVVNFFEFIFRGFPFSINQTNAVKIGAPFKISLNGRLGTFSSTSTWKRIIAFHLEVGDVSVGFSSSSLRW